jgi:hypothetical protein
MAKEDKKQDGRVVIKLAKSLPQIMFSTIALPGLPPNTF